VGNAKSRYYRGPFMNYLPTFQSTIDFNAEEIVSQAGIKYITIDKHHGGTCNVRFPKFRIIGITGNALQVFGDVGTSVKKTGHKNYLYTIRNWISTILTIFLEVGQAGKQDGLKVGIGVLLDYIKDTKLKNETMTLQVLVRWLSGIRRKQEEWHKRWVSNKELIGNWKSYKMIHDVDSKLLMEAITITGKLLLKGKIFKCSKKDLPGENTSGFGGNWGGTLSETCKAVKQSWGFDLGQET
jgi:hypothetical protein